MSPYGTFSAERGGNFKFDQYSPSDSTNTADLLIELDDDLLHKCSRCEDEGCSDVDSEGYESFGRLHEHRLHMQHICNTESQGYTKDPSVQAMHVSYRRAVDLHKMAIKEGWAKNTHEHEVQPACTGAHRRVRMVQNIKENYFLGRLWCKLLLVSERRVLNRPLLRGKVHLLMTYLTPWWAYRFIFARSKHLLGSLISAAAIFCCYFFSTVLHHKSPRCLSEYKRLREIDHIGIFLLGSLSPCVMVAHRASAVFYAVYMGWQIITCVSFSLLVIKFGFMKSPVTMKVATYVLLSIYQVCVLSSLNPNTFQLICFANFAWALLGGICFATRSPQLHPDIFSYHEVFHSLSLLGQFALLFLMRSTIDNGRSD